MTNVLRMTLMRGMTCNEHNFFPQPFYEEWMFCWQFFWRILHIMLLFVHTLFWHLYIESNAFLFSPSIKGRNFYGQNWINCSVSKMILQQHQLLTQLLFQSTELCLWNLRMQWTSTSLSVLAMGTLSMTFNILASMDPFLCCFHMPRHFGCGTKYEWTLIVLFFSGQMWLCGGSFIHKHLTGPAFT
jgi:hypothetical protein